MPLNRGLGFIEWRGEGEDGKGQAGVVHQVKKGEPYPWMSEEGFGKTMKQLRDMATTSFEDMARLMKTSLQDWLAERGLHPEAYDYIKVLAASQTAQAEPAMTPAGDFLGYMVAAAPLADESGLGIGGHGRRARLHRDPTGHGEGSARPRWRGAPQHSGARGADRTKEGQGHHLRAGR